MSKCSSAILTVAVAALSAQASFASPAYEFIDAPVSYDSQLSLGFSFTTTQAVTIDALGYWDYLRDGFATPHEVGIFDSVGNLLAAAILSAGTVDPLTDQFRYVPISPLMLGTGGTYTIAATTNGPYDGWAYGNGYGLSPSFVGFATAPGIVVDTNGALFVYQSDNILRDPTFHFSNYTVYAGPNFQVEASVPEPGSWSLLLAGAVATILVLLARRLGRCTAPA